MPPSLPAPTGTYSPSLVWHPCLPLLAPHHFSTCHFWYLPNSAKTLLDTYNLLSAGERTMRHNSSLGSLEYIQLLLLGELRVHQGRHWKNKTTQQLCDSEPYGVITTLAWGRRCSPSTGELEFWPNYGLNCPLKFPSWVEAELEYSGHYRILREVQKGSKITARQSS